MRRRLAAVSLVLAASCTRPAALVDAGGLQPSAPPVATVARPVPVAALGPTDAGAPVAATYVGSATCEACHDDEHAAWKQDWHARALAKATPASIVANFSNAHFRGASSEAWMRRSGGRARMRTTGLDGGLAEFPVDWVVGGKRMQDDLTAFPDGRWQILPIYFHVTGKEWVDYTEAKQGALTPDHPFYWTNFRRTANRECLDCHATGVEVAYDGGSHTWSTKMADPGVACEACHGPGSVHADSQLPSDIFRPAKAGPAEQLAICGQCHGPRQPLFPLLDSAHRFRPGERYDDHYQALVVTDGRERSGDYFPDGRPKTSSFEYQALVQSRCYREGGATCLTCHTAPHEPHGFDEVRPAPDAGAGVRPLQADEASCVRCHAGIAADRQAHTHHRAPQAQSCLACHMPKVLTGVLDTLADHALDVPSPENTARHGIPSACGLCHAKEKPEELQASLVRLWPNAPERQARRLRLADAIDEKTAAQSLEPLQAVIADANEAPVLRAAAGELLSQRFPAEAARALVPAVRDPSPLVRSKAARSLAAARDRTSADALAALLGDTSLWVRQAAALSLTQRGDPRGAPALYALAHGADSRDLPLPHELLAQIAAHRGDATTAAAEMREALARQPYAVEEWVALADIELQRGQPEQARAALEEALRFDPGHAGAKKRLAQLSPGRP